MPRGVYLTIVLTILTLAAACRPQTAAERAVVSYAAAILKGDCEAAWTLSSAATREAYELAAQQQPTMSLTAKELACNRARVEDWSLRKMHVASEAGNRVTVVVKKWVGTGPSLPGFSPIWRKQVDDPINVVFENGAWRVEDQIIVDAMSARRAAFEREQRMRDEYMKRRQRAQP